MRPLVLLVLTALLSASCGTMGLSATTPPRARLTPPLPPLDALQLPDDGALRHEPLRHKYPLRVPPRRPPPQS